jgi:hypothetical protein
MVVASTFLGTNPAHEPITSELPVIQAQSREALLIGCEGGHFHVQPTTRPSGFGPSRRPPPTTFMNARFPGGIQRSG